MDKLYPLSAEDICFAGAALDFLLGKPEYLNDVPPDKVRQMRVTRDRFEIYNSSTYTP